MITWSGFIGKTASFLATEVGKKLIAEKSDKKQLACELFTRLYFNLVELEARVSQIVTAAEEARKTQDFMTLYCVVSQQEKPAEKLTMEFYEIAQILREVLEIYFPDVEKALGSIFAWKGSILFEAERTVVSEYNSTVQFSRLRYKKPSDRLLEIDIAKHVEWLKRIPNWQIGRHMNGLKHCFILEK
jgi:hypothetical protein